MWIRTLLTILLCLTGCSDDPEPVDAGAKDAGFQDAAPIDARATDATTDSGPLDSSELDSGEPDSGAPDSGTLDSGTPDSGIMTSALEPLHANHADWNAYLANDGTDAITATDSDCPTSGLGPFSCLHGGELRQVAVIGYNDCANLTATDSASAMSWICDDSTSPVRMVSTGLQFERGLIDLIDAAGAAWQEITVQVADNGTVVVSTPPTPWANNPVLALPGSGALDTPNAVYAVTATTTGRFVLAEGVAISMAPDAALMCDGVSDEVVYSSGSRLWLEGTVTATNCLSGILVENGNTITMRRLRVTDSQWPGSGPFGAGIKLDTVSGSRFVQVTVEDCGLMGIFGLASVDGNLFEDFRSLRSGKQGQSIGRGLLVKGDRNLLRRGWEAATFGSGTHVSGNDNTIVDWQVNNTGSLSSFTNNALSISEGDRNIAAFIRLTHNEDSGVQFYRGANNILANLFVGSGDREAVFFTNGGQTTRNHVVMNVACANTRSILRAYIGEGVSVLDVAGLSLYGSALQLTDSDRFTFTGLIKMDTNSTKCSASGTEPGLIHVSCTDDGLDGSSTYTGQRSDALLSTDLDPAATFLGPVRTNDSSNQHDFVTAFDTLTDWFHFDSPERFWGRQVPQGEDFLDFDLGRRCDPGTTCQIIDWGLASNDIGDGGAPVLLDTLSIPGGDDAYTHQWYATDANDCALIRGASWDATNGCTSTFLRHAVELFFDGVGNDNALCEQDETCLYTPNLGAYQGHGQITTTATIGTGGLVENVTLLGYTNNGY